MSTKIEWWPGRPNFVFGDQNLNLLASMTTSIIEVGDQKFWIIFHQREKNIELEDSDQIIERIFVFTLLLCIYGYQFIFTLATKI